MSAIDNRRIAGLASDRSVHRAFQWLHLHAQQLLKWQMELIAIPAPPFLEVERSEWFREQFIKLNLQSVEVDSEGNVCGEVGAANASGDGPMVLVSAHLDTVFPAGTNCTPRYEEPLIHGPGACDNGAGLTALLALAAAVGHAGIVPATTIFFCANVGEEGPGDLRGMRHLFGESRYKGRIRAAIALEGAGTATVVDRALGSRRLRVSVTGPGGHSWADAGRPNPILALSSALLSVANVPLNRPSSAILASRAHSTLNVGTISGGTSVNSIPASATADIDLRSTAAMELDRIEMAVLSELTRTLEVENREVPAALQMGFEVSRIGDRPAGALAATAPLAMSLRAVDRHLNIATEPHIGSTDANLPLSLGIPALAIGAGGVGTGIHTLLETYDPTGRDLALRRVLLLVLDACQIVAEEA